MVQEAPLATQPVAMKLFYLCDEVILDADNILKPIHDALIGVIIEDDSIITDVEIHRRRLGTTFSLDAASPVLAAAFDLGGEFVYVMVSDAPEQDVLP